MMELVIKNRTFSNECFGWAHRKISRIVYSKIKRASCRNRTRSLCNITDDGIHSLQRDDQKVGTKKENSFDICKAILLAGLSFDVYADPVPEKAIWQLENHDVNNTWIGMLSNKSMQAAFGTDSLAELTINGISDGRCNEDEEQKKNIFQNLLKSSPKIYIKARYDDGFVSHSQSMCTSVKGGLFGATPEWKDEKLYFYVNTRNAVKENVLQFQICILSPLAIKGTVNGDLEDDIILNDGVITIDMPSFGDFSRKDVTVFENLDVALEPNRNDNTASTVNNKSSSLRISLRIYPLPECDEDTGLFDLTPMSIIANYLANIQKSEMSEIDALMLDIYSVINDSSKYKNLKSINDLAAIVTEVVKATSNSKLTNIFAKLSTISDSTLLSLCRSRALRVDFDDRNTYDVNTSKYNRQMIEEQLSNAITYDVGNTNGRLLENAMKLFFQDTQGGPNDKKEISILNTIKALSMARLGNKINNDAVIKALSEIYSTASEAIGGTNINVKHINSTENINSIRNSFEKAIRDYNNRILLLSSTPQSGRSLTSMENGSAWDALIRAAKVIDDNLDDDVNDSDPNQYERVAFVDDISTGTQCYIWKNDSSPSNDRKRLVVVFRGTETSQWKDIVTDLMVAPTPIPWDYRQSKKVSQSGNDLWVHSGFLGAYTSVRGQILRIVNNLIVNDVSSCNNCIWEICSSGHSLGGALATLFSYDVAQQRDHGRFDSCVFKPNTIVTCYTYGSPRVGNNVFVNEFNEIVDCCYRFYNRKDIVSTIPRLIGYSHVGVGVLLCSESCQMIVGKESRFNDDESCKNDEDFSENSMTLTSLLLKNNEINSIVVNNELQTLSEIFSGDAVAQHMEDYYFDVIHKYLSEKHLSTKSS